MTNLVPNTKKLTWSNFVDAMDFSPPDKMKLEYTDEERKDALHELRHLLDKI